MASKPSCKYGSNCYRKNPKHLRDFDHSTSTLTSDDSFSSVSVSVSGSEYEQVGDDVVEVGVEEDIEDDHGCNGNDKSDGDGDVKVGESLDNKIGVEKTVENNRRLRKRQKSVELEPKRKNSKLVHKQCTLGAFFSKKGMIEDSDHTNIKAAETSVCTSKSEQLETESNSLGGKASSLLYKTPTKHVQTTDFKHIIPDLYGMKMPDDLFHFWDFCKTLDSESPCSALHTVGLQLVGPYNIFSGEDKKTDQDVGLHLNYRYYYDPPEFMTLIAGKNNQFHMGYFRDDPEELPAFVGSNSADENCLISSRGENIFSAVKWYLDDRWKTTNESSTSKILAKLCNFAEEKKMCLDRITPKLKERQKKVVCKTFHSAGLVVPVDKNDVGYRPVPESPADLKKMLKKIVESGTEEERNTHLEPLEEIITYVQFANDECDYGEGVELGLDLFSYGSDVLHPFISSLLGTGYRLLKRNIYADIIRGFLPLRNRNKPHILTL